MSRVPYLYWLVSDCCVTIIVGRSLDSSLVYDICWTQLWRGVSEWKWRGMCRHKCTLISQWIKERMGDGGEGWERGKVKPSQLSWKWASKKKQWIMIVLSSALLWCYGDVCVTSCQIRYWAYMEILGEASWLLGRTSPGDTIMAICGMWL